eukprot:CAMPEP_0115840986 /NCGR_PEP_ID=MMETSP0287-20121206/7056_1 /TAXON_ID=412157 /ORGANISM="Chrysochromulina rotalis, Strain UIO044" /LENGTH=126 /DNA_ID=CAMNT_0003294619 /DNA_START=86 /DNA_END=463 /DNA_ORIENTATION=+
MKHTNAQLERQPTTRHQEDNRDRRCASNMPDAAAKKRAADAVRGAAGGADSPTKAILCVHVGSLMLVGAPGAACKCLMPMHERLTLTRHCSPLGWPFELGVEYVAAGSTASQQAARRRMSKVGRSR